MYSFLEQHRDGAWWYHPKATYTTHEEAELGFKKFFWWDLDRPHKIIEHSVPFPQDESMRTNDFIHFNYIDGRKFDLK